MRMVITGGGTGGHTSPAVAVLEELRRRDPQLLVQWIGKKNGMESRVARQHHVPFRSLPIEGWTRRMSPRMAWIGLKLCWSVFRSFLYLSIFRPQAVFGVGGYVSLPAIWAAQRLGIPTFLHEQNKRLGLANRICASKAVALLLSFPDTQGDYPREKSRVVGNPVRSAFLSPPSTTEARERFSLNATLPTVLVMGGSQGAHSINQAMANMAYLFKENEIQFIWATGQSEALWARNAVNEAPITVQVHAFIEDMATACAASDMVVSRAGASSTAELAAMGKPSILVPYPHAADNHQEHNARAFEQTGAAVVLLDKECTGDALSSIIKELLSQPLRLQNMSQAAFSLAKLSAAEEIAETIVRRVWGTEEITAT